MALEETDVFDLQRTTTANVASFACGTCIIVAIILPLHNLAGLVEPCLSGKSCLMLATKDDFCETRHQTCHHPGQPMNVSYGYHGCRVKYTEAYVLIEDQASMKIDVQNDEPPELSREQKEGGYYLVDDNSKVRNSLNHDFKDTFFLSSARSCPFT